MVNKKRLINANALLEELEKFANPMPNKSGYDFLCGVASAITEIENAPTVDAVEVVHGRWIEHPNVEIVDGKPISNYECSECCCFYRTHENYCGFCGAKMDGGNEDG